MIGWEIRRSYFWEKAEFNSAERVDALAGSGANSQGPSGTVVFREAEEGW